MAIMENCIITAFLPAAMRSLVLYSVIQVIIAKLTSAKASLCLTCLTEPPALSQQNLTFLLDYLARKGVKNPAVGRNCKETPINAQPEFKGVPAHQCFSGACVKLKGTLGGEYYIARGCWDDIWLAKHSLDKEYTGCSYMDFLKDSDGHLCVCYGDLCNEGTRNTFYNVCFFIFLLYISVIIGRKIIQ